MLRKTSCWCAAGALILLIAQPIAAELSDEQVRQAIRRGSDFLKSQQKPDGSWTSHQIYVGGVTSLITLALLNSGEDVDSPVIQKALDYLRSLEQPKMVYSAALQTMALCAAEPDKDRPLILRNVEWLENSQLRTGKRAGCWSYGEGRVVGGDNSNAQFALLALHEAELVGVPVQQRTWELALDYWLRTQREDGAWGYTEDDPATGSMTCAGIASVVICSGKISEGDARVSAGSVICCGDHSDNDAVERGLQWLGKKFSASRNPSSINLGQTHLLYYLYAVERVGRMTGRRFIGRHDWYRAGAASLLELQEDFRGFWEGQGAGENVPTIGTAFALLFLSKGRRPVVMSKLRYGDGVPWDLHRNGVHNLTRRIEQRWERDLTWQTIDAKGSMVGDLLETPVLFLSGTEAFTLTAEQKENLKQYIDQGGFIFAERCCGGEGFDRSFRELMKELFPASSLRLLPETHPIWYAEEKVDPQYLRPLLGIEACCRTSVVYCPEDLSCYWELNRGLRNAQYPGRVQAQIEAALRIGENVVTYATSRELKNKLDRPSVAMNRPADSLDRSILFVPKLTHDGGSDDAPNALPNLLNFVRSQAQIRIGVENRLVSATSDELFDYPILFVHGRRAFRFSNEEREALKLFIERGGVLFADAICANSEFADSFRRELAEILPGNSLTRIPPNHPMFTSEFRGYDLGQLTIRDPEVRRGDDPLKANLTKVSPYLEGITIDDHVAVLLSPYDISCAMENSTSLECKGYIKEDAARLATNVILFALQQ